MSSQTATRSLADHGYTAAQIDAAYESTSGYEGMVRHGYSAAEVASLRRRLAAASLSVRVRAVPAWPSPSGTPVEIALPGGRALQVVRLASVCEECGALARFGVAECGCGHSVRKERQGVPCDECGAPAPYGSAAENGCGHYHPSCLARRIERKYGPNGWPRTLPANLRVGDLIDVLPEED